MLDRAQVGAYGKRFVETEFKLGHIRVTRRYPALEQAGKLIEIEATAKRAERRRAGVRATARFSYGMTARAEFDDHRTAVAFGILRVCGTSTSERNK